MFFRKWRESDSAKLRKLEKRFDELQSEYKTLKSYHWNLRRDYRVLEKRVAEKEVTHVQTVKVELTKPFDYDGWYP